MLETDNSRKDSVLIVSHITYVYSGATAHIVRNNLSMPIENALMNTSIRTGGTDIVRNENQLTELRLW